MSRIFNISFPYGESIYNALVIVKGGDESTFVSIRVDQGQIQLNLPHGRLIFPIVEVVKYFAGLRRQNVKNMVMPITDSISLHLMNNNDW